MIQDCRGAIVKGKAEDGDARMMETPNPPKLYSVNVQT